MRFYSVAALYALWLLGMFFVFYLVHGQDETALQLVLICGAIPAACQLFLLGIDWRGLVAPVKMWLALLLIILLSYLANATDSRYAPFGAGLAISPAWTPVVYTIDVIFITAIGTVVAGCPDRRLLREIGGFYALFAVPFLAYVDVTGEMVWGRLSANDLQPNSWGLMGLTACLAAFARKLGPIAVAAFAAGGATILLASSREQMLALAIVAIVVVVLQVPTINRPRLFVLLGISCVSLVALALLLDPYVLRALRYISSDVLFLNDTDRGLDSGFTGRTGVWADTIDLWTKSPIFGVGFRQHEQFLAGVPAHNAYLAMLADTGLVGFVFYLVLMVRSLFAAWGLEDPTTRRFVVAAIVGYAILGFFDRRAINAGNPYGLLILMCWSLALADQSRRRVVAVWRTRSLHGASEKPPLPAAG